MTQLTDISPLLIIPKTTPEEWVKLGSWQRFRYENKTLTHARGILLLGSPPTKRMTFRKVKGNKTERYAALLDILTKSKKRSPALEPVTFTECSRDCGTTHPSLVFMKNPQKDFIVAIQLTFYDIIVRKWPDANFICQYRNRFVYAYTPKGDYHLTNNWVSFIRPYNLGE